MQSYEKDKDVLDEEELSVVKKIVGILGLFDEYSRKMSIDSFSPSDVIYLLKTLKITSEKMMLGDEALIDICKEFTGKLNKATAEAYQDEFLQKAIFLDPRWSCRGTLYGELVWNNIKERILFKNDSLCLDNQIEPDMRKDPKSHEINPLECLLVEPASKKTRVSTLQLEIDDYVRFCTKEARPSTTESLYLWWFQNKARFKNLYAIAVQYMSPPASSVSSERVFRSRVWPTSLETRYGYRSEDSCYRRGATQKRIGFKQ